MAAPPTPRWDARAIRRCATLFAIFRFWLESSGIAAKLLMDIRPLLVDLLGYTERMAAIGERAVFRLVDYRSLVFHEHDLRNRTGVHHDVLEGEERSWLKVDRLTRLDPPSVPEEIKDWLVVGRNPFESPTVQEMRVVTLNRRDAEMLVESGRAKVEDVKPAMREGNETPPEELRDVVLRLENDQKAQASVRAYVEGVWATWAGEEKPRRETIRIYEALFRLQQSIETQGIERPLEVVWGVGLARWQHPKREIDHPLIEQLVEIDIDAQDGAIHLRPRSIEPTLAIKPYQELEISSADTLVRFAREHFRQLGSHSDFSPFNKTSFEPVLRQAFSLLDPEGTYHPDHIEDYEDRNLPGVGPTLTVTDTWAIYARPRSANIVVEDIARLKDRVQGTDPENLPGNARRLVSVPDDTLPPGGFSLPMQLGTGLAQKLADSGSSLGEESAFYFPKPFNDEQIEIVKRLEREDGVVVQGPPGTGKTHTIANIICHYMATGRRVLVVSHGEAALNVLRDQIPPEVRELAISLLSSERQGLKQLEKAVRLLADDVSQEDPRSLALAIDEAEQRVIRLKEKIADIDVELRSWADKHLKPVGGQSTSLPMHLARWVVENRSSYGWLEDRPPIEGALEFDDADVARLRDARKALGKDIAYVGVSLPAPNDLPEPTVVAAVHEDLVTAESIAVKNRSGGLPPLSLTVENSRERAQSLVTTLNRLIEALDARAREPWLDRVFEIARKGDALPESGAFGRVQEHLARVSEGLRRFLDTRVEVPSELFADQRTLERVRQALARKVSGQSAFALLSFGQGRAKELYGKIRVDGELVSGVEEATHARDYLAWRDDLVDLRHQWNYLATLIELPEVEEDGEVLGKWASETHSKIVIQFTVAREHLPTATRELRLLFPVGLSVEGLADEPTAARGTLEALELNLSRQRLEESRAKLKDTRNRLTGPAEIAKQMRAFVDEVVGRTDLSREEVAARWENFLSILRRLRSLQPEFDTVLTVTEEISKAGAPRWAERLKKEPVDGLEDALTPGDWREAWGWAQQESHLRSIDGRTRLSSLAKERLAAGEELERLFREVVRNRTFLMLNIGMTNRVRAALVMFVSAIRHIGAGTGIRARRFRRDARDAMENCYSAVPCWIMPTWRVSENLPSIPGSFDLVIVDEASQSDVLALPAILRGKKVLVVGDDKQVSPVPVGVEERTILQLRHNYLQSQPFAAMLLPGRSLYDLMGAVYPGQRTLLREHFRCVEPIIRFSAREFYDNQIRPLRIPKASERLDPPLIDIYVENGWKEGKVNPAEARVIVDEIERIVNDAVFARRTIGVVSLIGANQAETIQNMLLDRIGEERFLRHQIACGDSATFQGKERDVMFVSMVEAPNSHATRTATIFQQRFNVALSRARDRMYLVRSLDEEALRPDDLKAKIIRHFKSPMEGAPIEAENSIALCESEFEREVYSKLAQRGWRVRPQVRAGDYRIDLVIEGAEDQRLAIELDGDKYHGPEKWTEDHRRQLALERMGWRFWRCWGSSWTLDSEECLADLEATLKSLGIEPLGGETRPARYTEHRVVGRASQQAETTPSSPSAQVKPTPPYPTRRRHDAQRQLLRSSAETPGGQRATTPPARPETQSRDGASVDETPALLSEEERVIKAGDQVVIVYSDDPSNPKTLILTDQPDDDPKMGIIFVGRPIGQALLGQPVDEIVEVPAGARTREATVLRIERTAA